MLSAEEYEAKIAEIPTYDIDGKSYNQGSVVDEYSECLAVGHTHEQALTESARVNNLSIEAVEAIVAVDEYERFN